MYTVYVLRSQKDGKRYIGYTSDLRRRLAEHNAGETKSTRWRRPFDVVYTEMFEEKTEAQRREKFFKSGAGRKELKRLLGNDAR